MNAWTYSSLSVSERQTMPPAVAVSSVAFALQPPPTALLDNSACVTTEGNAPGTTLWLPLVRRTRPPFEGRWALPGDVIPWNETLTDTAVRTLRQTVGHDPSTLEQLYSFGEVERSASAQRLVTIAYWAIYGEEDFSHPPADVGSRDGGAPDPVRDPNVAWFSADKLPDLAFDHADIVAYAIDRLRSKTEYSTIAHRFLGQTFTLAQLRQVREAILGECIDPANFRRQALAQGYLEDTGMQSRGGRHRPARLYRFRDSHARTLGGPHDQRG